MPELPEVETIKRDLKKKILGLRFMKITIYDTRILKDHDEKLFKQELRLQVVCDVTRRGKAVIFALRNKQFLMFQPKMTGQLIYVEGSLKKPYSKDTKVVFRLSNGKHLLYNDQRLFGKLTLLNRLEDSPYLKTIGPEPLEKDFSLDWLREKLKSRKAPIKTLLMNQQFLAGIGNIYASEILFHSRIHPRKSARQLRDKQIQSLYCSTKETLQVAIRYRGTSMRNYRDASGREGRFKNRIQVYNRENQECTVCRQPITKIVQSGRSTFFCKTCQGQT